MERFCFEDLSSDHLKILRIADHPELQKECRRLVPCPEDREELTATRGSWHLSVHAAADSRGAHCCIYKGKVRALFGFAGGEVPRCLLPWLISDGMIQKELPIEFSRICRRILKRVKSSSLTLLNWAMEDCQRYDWLEQLGFVIGNSRMWLRGKPFRRFMMRPEEEKKNV